jgi:nucleoid-associated protein YgaU
MYMEIASACPNLEYDRGPSSSFFERKHLMSDEKKPDIPGAKSWDATQWHEVVKGDTLSKIAEKYYGDPALYPQIFEANKDILTDPNKIQIGQKLRIP